MSDPIDLMDDKPECEFCDSTHDAIMRDAPGGGRFVMCEDCAE